MKEKTIVSSVTLAASLICYFYAKEAQKDTIPFVMIGGFMGAMIGEVIVEALNNSNNDKDKKED